ncbi:MAG: hypothetical protein Q7T13_01700 [Polaromonas sp.]|nr:hypothetical protein [Polaromonas sp.]
MIERHLTTIIVSLATGAIVFSASYFFTDKADKAVLTNQLQSISIQVAELRTEVRGIQSNFATKDSHNDHEVRIRALEKRVK